MRRSRSSSNIPLSTFKRNISNENLGSSQQSSRTSQGLRRSNSSINLFSAQKLLVPSTSYRTEVTSNDALTSTSNRRITATPLRSVGSGSVCRRINATPRSQSKTAPSPCVLLTTSKINDKKFSSDQFKKICAFVGERSEDFDPKSLKPLTLSSFVQTISMLFRELDPRININMANYKEVVFKYLKLYKYPGPVSMSLLKSVNTNLSWTQVMSIFGWLVDLIHETSKPVGMLEQYILGRAQTAFRPGSETKGLHIEYIEEILNFDRTEGEILENECEILRQEAEAKVVLINEKKTKNDMLCETLQQMEIDIKEFKEDNLEDKIKNEISELQSEFKIRVMKIEEMKEIISSQQKIIANQKYSLKDKQELLKKIEEKKYSLSLKKEELENIYKLKDDYDYQQTNYRRKIETEIHKINGRLLQLPLGNFVDDAKKIRLPDRGMHKPKFIEEIEEKKQLLENISEKISSEFQETQVVLSRKTNSLNKLCSEVNKQNKENDLLKKEIEQISVEKSRVLFEFDVQQKQHENKTIQLIQNAPDIESIKNKKEELQKEVLVLREKLTQIGDECMEICKKIHEETREKAIQMRAIMADLTEKAAKACQSKVQKETEIADMLSENVSD
ncbi:kinetochore protein NDC80 homolog [Coccinella septempunctata]|uniref:kinetochore protein NDC80 homolog n=1 Tax=Coccinella septempunctata TaxID=41139 RepID=UPI001D07A4DD|nr:kinetochore protein NDC80 homolog [Coccinella septempunctata]